MTAYHVTRPDPPAAVVIRIRRVNGGAWLPVQLLVTTPGWVQVDDGEGPLWVMIEHVCRQDWPKLATFERLRDGRNQ